MKKLWLVAVGMIAVLPAFAQPYLVEDTSGSAVAVVQPLGQPVEPSVSEVTSWISALVAAVNSGNWTLAVALGLMLAVFIARKFFLTQVPGKYLPWAVIGLSVLGAGAAALYAGTAPLEALVQGIVTGLSAVGAWEAAKPMTSK